MAAVGHDEDDRPIFVLVPTRLTNRNTFTRRKNTQLKLEFYKNVSGVIYRVCVVSVDRPYLNYWKEDSD